jgi:hypothetical protein
VIKKQREGNSRARAGIDPPLFEFEKIDDDGTLGGFVQ